MEKVQLPKCCALAVVMVAVGVIGVVLFTGYDKAGYLQGSGLTITPIPLAYTSSHKIVTDHTPTHNVPSVQFTVNHQQVFYNRVPKCGSSLVKGIIKSLAGTNNFSFKTSRHYLDYFINRAQQAGLVKKIEKYNPPIVYERHVNFINFTRFNHSMPVYINIIRDPIDRLTSWYYFIRFKSGHSRPMTDKKRNQTYDECVEMNMEECTAPNSYYHLIPFFCGQELYCKVPGEQSLSQAMKNVELYYSLVGILDDLHGFFYVLDHTIPRFFKGALQLYEKQETRSVNSNRKRKSTTLKTVKLMENRLKYDYAFYYFIKQRFYSQLHNVHAEHQDLSSSR